MAELREFLTEHEPGIDALCAWPHAPDDQMIHDCALGKITVGDLRELLRTLKEFERDAARLDWLQERVVNVRTPLFCGSSDLFWSSPDEDGESALRATIDNYMDAEVNGSASSQKPEDR